MSGAVRSQVLRHFGRALEAWPKDPLRPDCQLPNVLAKRLEKEALAPNTSSLSASARDLADLKQTNALISLLENRYQNKYRIRGKLMEPRSNPKYYEDLKRELEEAPNRSFLTRLKNRLSGMLRF